MGMLARHYSGYRADAPGAVKGWRERLKGQRTHLGTRLANLDANREKDYETAARRPRICRACAEGGLAPLVRADVKRQDTAAWRPSPSWARSPSSHPTATIAAPADALRLLSRSCPPGEPSSGHRA